MLLTTRRLLLHTADTALPLNFVDALGEDALDLATPPGTHLAVEQQVDFFESLAAGFRVGEEDLESHDEAEDAENDVGSPLDVCEGWGDEEGKGD